MYIYILYTYIYIYIYIYISIYEFTETYVFEGVLLLALAFVLAFVPETREPLLRGEY